MMRIKSVLTIAAGVFLGLLAVLTVYKAPGFVISFIRKYHEISASTHAMDVVLDLKTPEQVIARCGKPLEDTQGVLPKEIAEHSARADAQDEVRRNLTYWWDTPSLRDTNNTPAETGERRKVILSFGPDSSQDSCFNADCIIELSPIGNSVRPQSAVDGWSQDSEGLLSDLPCLDDPTKRRGFFEKVRLTYDELQIEREKRELEQQLLRVPTTP